MSNVKKTKDEKTISDLKKLVVKIEYSENIATTKKRIDSARIKEIAKKVGKHLNDDSLSTANPARS